MGLLGNNEEKNSASLEKYHIDDLDPKYLNIVKGIADDLAKINLLEYAKGGSPDICQMALLSAIARQNFIIIQLLDEIAKK